MSSWRDKLRPASFRGVPFHVEGDDMTVGRRTETYEYPQRDKPFVQDFGRMAREMSFPAFVIGDDYMTRRDALIAAIEQKGPGALVHPQYGTVSVAIKGGCHVTHSREENGMARIALSFVEAGDLAFPSAAPATESRVTLATSALSTAARASAAARISVAGLPEHVELSAMARAAAALKAVQGAWGMVSPAGIIGSVQTLLRAPAAFANGIADLFVGVTGADYASLLRGAFGSLDLLTRLPKRRSLTTDASATPAALQVAANDAAIDTLLRTQLIITAADALAGMPSLPIADDAESLRDRIVAALDAEASTADDDVFAAITALSVAVARDVSARARDSARLRTITPRAVLPACVIAYDLYEDAARGDEIVARNRVRHPTFVQASALQVLSA